MGQTEHLRVGLCGIGLEAYWGQFAGLKARLEDHVGEAANRIRRPGHSMVNLGLIDTPIAAREAAHTFRTADLDLLFIYITTYAVSSIVLPLAQRVDAPVVVLNLQPDSRIDYATFNKLKDRTAMTGSWLEYCSACPALEIANLMQRAKIPFRQVTGTLKDGETWREIDEWLSAATVKRSLESNRLGLLGHYYNGMLDVMADVTQLAITFGSHLEILEVDELSGLCAQVGDEAVAARVRDFREHFDVQPDCEIKELERAARTSVALDEFVGLHDLHSLAYYYEGTGNAANLETMSSVILGMSMLTARHIPAAGEYEVKNAIAMKIMDSFDAGGSFTEFYAVDYAEDLVLMGHDGPGHIAIAEGKTKVRPLQTYHGKVGSGVSVEMSVRHGPVTLLSVVEDMETGFKLLVAEGECVPGDILEIGNTNSRYRFPMGARDFLERWSAQGPAHHCAVGIGHLAGRLKKLADLLNINCHQLRWELHI
ncbi:MAG: arabinose isomerase [Acidobacteriaceae bacterium]